MRRRSCCGAVQTGPPKSSPTKRPEKLSYGSGIRCASADPVDSAAIHAALGSRDLNRTALIAQRLAGELRCSVPVHIGESAGPIGFGREARGAVVRLSRRLFAGEAVAAATSQLSGEWAAFAACAHSSGAPRAFSPRRQGACEPLAP
jgi:hypothetical protein